MIDDYENIVRPFHEGLWMMFEEGDNPCALLINLVHALTRHDEMCGSCFRGDFPSALINRLSKAPADDRLVVAFRNLAVELTGVACAALETKRREAKTVEAA